MLLLLILICVIILLFFVSKKENYSYPFSAHFYPDTLASNYQQMSRIPYILPPVGPYSLGWDSQQYIKKEYPSKIEIYDELYPY